MSRTRFELEQIRNSREYLDQILFGPGAESGIDLNSDINNIISAIRRIIYGNPSGTGNWFDAVPASLSELSSVSGISNQTWTDVFNEGSGILNISLFDANINIDSGRTYNIKDSSGDIIYSLSDTQHSLKRVGRRESFEVQSTIEPTSTFTLPNSITYTPDIEHRNLEIRENGQVLIPGSGITKTDENFGDYRELNSTQVVFNIKIKNKEFLDIRTFG